MDVVKFFSEHIFQDLQASQGAVHPILQVDAIRFLYTFRNQVLRTFYAMGLRFLLYYLVDQVTIARGVAAARSPHQLK